MLYNYHTHTSRCNHATGKDCEYVDNAIIAGYKVIGFSDHMPFKENGKTYDMSRMNFSLKDDYEKAIRNLQKKYQDKIEIHLAFECEYFPELEEYYQTLLKEVDYLILGTHYVYLDYKYKNIYSMNSEGVEGEEFALLYRDNTIKGLETGYFKILAHPDFYMRGCNWNEITEKIAYDICNSCKKNNVYLELNEAKIRANKIIKVNNETRYPYPYEEFWKIAKKVCNKIVVGVDAHDPKDFLNKKAMRIMEEFIKKLDLEVETNPEIMSKGNK